VIITKRHEWNGDRSVISSSKGFVSENDRYVTRSLDSDKLSGEVTAVTDTESKHIGDVRLLRNV